MSALVTAGVVASLAVGGSSAHATTRVTCGSTLTVDTTLTRNLRCPTGDGLILGAGVTLDLGGHRLIGGGSGIGVTTTEDNDGSNTIRNGTIVDWGTGLSLHFGTGEPSAPHVVADVVLRRAPFRGSTPVKFARVLAVDSPFEAAFARYEISDSTLRRSPLQFFSTTATISDSILVQSRLERVLESRLAIESSRLNGNGITPLGRLTESTLSITDSVVRNFSEPVTGMWGLVRFTGSRFADMPNGVLGDISSGFGFRTDSPSLITGNTFVRSGVALRGNVPMVVVGNTFARGTTGVEFTISPPLDPSDPAPTAEGSRAVGNVLKNNAGTGISTDLAGLEIGTNRAVNNGGFGIRAPGAIDLGGNIAFGNLLGQCLGVVCARR